MDGAFKALIVSCDGSPDTFGNRVYPAYSPQAPTLAQIVYRLITAPRDYVQEGTSDGVTTFRYQTDIYALTNKETETIRNLLLAGMSGKIGRVYDGIRIQAAFLNNDQLFNVPELDTPGARQYRRILDWMITADELIPLVPTVEFGEVPYTVGVDANAASFNVTNALVGATFGWSIVSSGGGSPVTGSGVVAAVDFSVAAINLSGLPQGMLTLTYSQNSIAVATAQGVLFAPGSGGGGGLSLTDGGYLLLSGGA